MRNHLLELCSGAAAVSLATYGSTPPAAYRGGKRRYAYQILEALGLPKYSGGLFFAPLKVTLNDPGLWGKAWQLVADGVAPAAAQASLAWTSDGEALFNHLIEQPVPEDGPEWLATFLALQGACMLGKEVTVVDKHWRTSGYGILSVSARERGFRERLLRLSVARRCSGIPQDFVEQMTASREFAQDVHVDDVTHVLIDPPYQGVGGYSHSLSRQDVVRLALDWYSKGASVGVCEHGPIEELAQAGFTTIMLEAAHGAPRTASRSTREMLMVKKQEDE